MRALISVSNKEGVLEFAAALKKLHYEIISTGGTAKVLQEGGVSVTPIEEVTGNPEILDGRVKTLSYQISAGLLARDKKELESLGLKAIDVVVCNLYPFDSKKEDLEMNQLVEWIDIGGPTMVRSAAKNFQRVSVLTSPKQYQEFLQRGPSLELRKKWAGQAFEMTAAYDRSISQVFNQRPLRYGENPHQKAFVHVKEEGGLAHATPLQGKELSYNNLLDSDAAWKCLSELMNLGKEVGCVVLKHNNPCGVALGDDGAKVIAKAWSGDPVSAFGGIIAFSGIMTAQEAEFFQDKFVEIIMAQGFDDDARKIFSKKKNLRLISLGLIPSQKEWESRPIGGGELRQESDHELDSEFQLMTQEDFTPKAKELVPFGVVVTKHLKSNALTCVLQEDDTFFLYCAGMGQPNRIHCLTKIMRPELEKLSGEKRKDLVLVSDAFFPFSDIVKEAHELGLKFLVQPGGSIRDQEVIDQANQNNQAFIFTGRRHFRH